MSDSTKLAKFVNKLALVLAVFSIIDIVYCVLTFSLGLSIIKSFGTLSLAFFMYLSLNKPGFFKTKI
jgi:hypothetical protein